MADGRRGKNKRAKRNSGNKGQPSNPERRRFLGNALGALAGSLLTRSARALGPNTQAVPLGSSADADPSSLDAIVEARIYPAIGVARLGDSQDPNGFFIGPETVDSDPTDSSISYRDFKGALKRQAAQFRLYGYDARGRVVRELTSDCAEIQWTVHLANKKAQWYRFIVALDIPEASKSQCARRNPDVPASERESLVIDGGPRTLLGASQRLANPVRGQFPGVSGGVLLGDLRTDGRGRLQVLGGYGKSASPSNKPIFESSDIESFNNASGWYDDISDGPVTATVKIGKRTLTAESAWVVVAPPNYAPYLKGWRTMYDLLIDVFTANKIIPPPPTTSFESDVLPVLQRLTELQWVNKGYADRFGIGSQWNFKDNALIQKISDPKANADLRKQIFDSFRVDVPQNSNPLFLKPEDPAYRSLWPQLYGDAYGTFPGIRNSLVLEGVRLIHMRRWVAGEFSNSPPANISLQEEPEMLSRAALEYCLADAFHPGCELTWPMRQISIYRRSPAPGKSPLLFRIRSRGEELDKAVAVNTPTAQGQGHHNSPEPLAQDYGPQLTQEICFRNDGPLQAQGPGDLTKWMALPWQGDTAFCRSGYEPELDPYIPTFWPARVPNQVLTRDAYNSLVNPKLDLGQRRAAFEDRESWLRELTGDISAQMIQMVNSFGGMGLLQSMPRPNDPEAMAHWPELPDVLMVETPPNLPKLMRGGAPRGFPPPGLTGGTGTDAEWRNTKLQLEEKYPTRTAEIEKVMADLHLKLGAALERNPGLIEQAGWQSLLQLAEYRLLLGKGRLR